MLKFLHIENIAVIESSDIEFTEGFNVLTGETGAGKSIVIDAINAVLGERTSKELIRAGCDTAEVSAVFGNFDDGVISILNEYGVTPDDDGNIIIRRRLSQSGKGLIKLNNRPVTVTELKSKFNAQSEEGKTVYLPYNDILPKCMNDGKISAAHKGTILHLFLKFTDFYADDTRTAVENCKNYLVQNSFLSQEEVDSVDLKVVETFLNSDICKEIKCADTVHKEIPFNICVNGDIPSKDPQLSEDTVLLQGIIDCLYVKNGKFFIVDYKTDNGRLNEDELVEQYRPQLELYRIAAEKITGCEFGGAFLYFLNRGVLRNIDK